MAFSRTKLTVATAGTNAQPLSRAIFDAIRHFDTCAIANAIEHFRVWLPVT